jgi:hypothetical protein
MSLLPQHTFAIAYLGFTKQYKAKQKSCYIFED